jgi:hypothetical protein
MRYLGVLTTEEYRKLGQERRLLGPRVAYNLLDVGSSPSREDVEVFEDICFTLRLSNGTYRTSFRNRFQDVNALVDQVLAELFDADQPLMIQDRAVSHALTSLEWAQAILARFPAAQVEASDLTLHLLEVTAADGTRYITEPDGTFLQAILPPFVVSLYHPEALRYPLHRLVASRAKKRLAALQLPKGWAQQNAPKGVQVKKISLVHPEARAFAEQDGRFSVVWRSVFDRDPASCNVLRTVNILNRAYFSEQELIGGIDAAFLSLREGGVWIVGRTTEEDLKNHVTLFRRGTDRWEVLARAGNGTELEDLVLGWRVSG